MNNPMKNFTKGRKTKTSIQTEIEPDKLQEKAKLLEEAAEENQRVLEKPSAEIVFKELDEKMKAEPHYWIKDPATSKQIRSEVLEEYNKKLKDNGLLSEEEKET